MRNPEIVLVTTDQEKNFELSKLKVDILEVRVDLFKDTSEAYATKIFNIRRKLKIPLLLTVRNDKKEGAQKAISDAKKWALLQALMPLADWVDIELSSKLCNQTIKLAHSLRKKVVVSAHDFNSTPKNIEALYKKAKAVKAHAVKFAFYAKNEHDVMRLIDFTDDHRKEFVVTMCVGPWGALSRLLLPNFGSRWVYTFLQNPTAPGQMNIFDLKKLHTFLVG